MARWRVTFWLDDQKTADMEVGESVIALKLQRRFTPTIRDGIRLIVDLKAGRTDVLFALFPALQSQLQPAAPPPDTERLERKIEQLQLLMTQNAPALPAPQQPALSAGLKPMNTPAIPMPTFDDTDEQDTVIIRRDVTAPGKMAADFVNSALSLQQAGQQ